MSFVRSQEPVAEGRPSCTAAPSFEDLRRMRPLIIHLGASAEHFGPVTWPRSFVSVIIMLIMPFYGTSEELIRHVFFSFLSVLFCFKSVLFFIPSLL